MILIMLKNVGEILMQLVLTLSITCCVLLAPLCLQTATGRFPYSAERVTTALIGGLSMIHWKRIAQCAGSSMTTPSGIYGAAKRFNTTQSHNRCF